MRPYKFVITSSYERMDAKREEVRADAAENPASLWLPQMKTCSVK